MTNVIDLFAWKKAKARKKRVKGPPKTWGVTDPAAIPVQKKGIVSGGVLHCPICGAKCYFTGAPLGRGHRTFENVHKPICGFRCAWSGVNHFRQGSSTDCPGCAQNPEVQKEQQP